MKTDPRVTWILPVKNSQKYLNACLESIHSQTYKHYTIIAIDNGSTDDSVSILKSWIPDKIPGKILYNSNLSLGGILAQAVNASETEYCARIDADDINMPERLELQINFLEKHKDVGVLGSFVEYIDESGKFIRHGNVPWINDADLKWRLRFANPFIHPSVTFRKEVVLLAGNYSDIMPGQDYDLWMRLSKHTNFAMLSRELIKNRQWDGQITNVHSKNGIDTNNELVKKYIKILYPNINKDLISKIYRCFVRREKKIKLIDIYNLRKLAKLTAVNENKISTYYTKSSFYLLQIKNSLKEFIFQKPL